MLLILLTLQVWIYNILGIIVVEVPGNSVIPKNYPTIEVDKGIDSRNLTFCFHFQVTNDSIEYLTMFSDINNNFFIYMRVYDGYGFIGFQEKYHIFFLPEYFVFSFTWFHMCISFNETHYSVVMQGTIIFVSERYEFRPEVILIEKIDFAKRNEEFQKGFLLSKLNIWSTTISNSILQEYSKDCSYRINLKPDIQSITKKHVPLFFNLTFFGKAYFRLH